MDDSIPQSIEKLKRDWAKDGHDAVLVASLENMLREIDTRLDEAFKSVGEEVNKLKVRLEKLQPHYQDPMHREQP